MANPNLVLNNHSSKSYVGIGSTYNYTVEISNFGGTTTATNIILTDLIPMGADFIIGSVTIDNVGSPTDEPSLGINIPDLGVGAITTVLMGAKVMAIPPENPMVNYAQVDFQYFDGVATQSSLVSSSGALTTINAATLVVSKVAPSIVGLGNVLQFSVTIGNYGTTTALSVTLIDTIPLGTTFVPGSIQVGGTTVAGSPAPPSGVLVGNLPAGFEYHVTFKANVVSIPSTTAITNYADSSCSYIVDPSTTTTTSARFTSNITTTSIAYATLTTVTLESSQDYATCSDIITFTVTIPNIGNITALNVTIIDTIPNGMTFVSNSVNINGTTVPGISPQAPLGMNIGSIPAGQTSTVKYNCQINC